MSPSQRLCEHSSRVPPSVLGGPPTKEDCVLDSYCHCNKLSPFNALKDCLSYRSEAHDQFFWTKIQGQYCAPSGGPQENPIPLPSLASRGTSIPWFLDPSSIFKASSVASYVLAGSCFHPVPSLTLSLLPSKGSYAYIGHTWIIQNNLPILRS